MSDDDKQPPTNEELARQLYGPYADGDPYEEEEGWGLVLDVEGSRLEMYGQGDPPFDILTVLQLFLAHGASSADADKLSSLTERLRRSTAAQQQTTTDNTPEKG